MTILPSLYPEPKYYPLICKDIENTSLSFNNTSH